MKVFKLANFCLCVAALASFTVADEPQPVAPGFTSSRPRISIDIQETIEGIQDDHGAANWIKEKAGKNKLRIVEPTRFASLGAKRANLLGRKNEANLRQEGIVSNTDYIIQGKVSGSQQKEQGLYGSKPGIRFSLGMEMTVTEVATGIVIATTTIPPRDILVRNLESPQSAFRQAIDRLMKGDEKNPGAQILFNKMETHWRAEKTSGETYRIEFLGMNLQQANLLSTALSNVPDITNLQITSIDAAGISVFECQTTLSSINLATLIEKTVTGFKLDRSAPHYLSFCGDGKSIEILTPPQIVWDPSSATGVVFVNPTQETWFGKYLNELIISVLVPSSLFFRKLRAAAWRLLKNACTKVSDLVKPLFGNLLFKLKK